MKDRLQFAAELALRAGSLLREGFGHGLEVRHKDASINLITDYDIRSEQLLVEELSRAFPEDSILAEERGSRGKGPSQWLIDPLDGTTNFAHGVPLFSVSIAYAHALEPQLGVVHDPIRDELFTARKGAGAWLGDRPLRVSETRDLEESLLVTGFPYDIQSNPDNNLDHFAEMSLRARGVRRLGSAALDLAYVAAGRFDGYWELRLWPWDWGAGMLLVQEAGGTVTRTDGGADVFAQPTSMLATNGRIHEQMLAVLRRDPRNSG